MQFSARDRFSGTIKNIVKGPVSADVIVTVAPGIDVVAVISAASANEPGLATGRPARHVKWLRALTLRAASTP